LKQQKCSKVNGNSKFKKKLTKNLNEMYQYISKIKTILKRKEPRLFIVFCKNKKR